MDETNVVLSNLGSLAKSGRKTVCRLFFVKWVMHSVRTISIVAHFRTKQNQTKMVSTYAQNLQIVEFWKSNTHEKWSHKWSSAFKRIHAPRPMTALLFRWLHRSRAPSIPVPDITYTLTRTFRHCFRLPAHLPLGTGTPLHGAKMALVTPVSTKVSEKSLLWSCSYHGYFMLRRRGCVTCGGVG